MKSSTVTTYMIATLMSAPKGCAFSQPKVRYLGGLGLVLSQTAPREMR